MDMANYKVTITKKGRKWYEVLVSGKSSRYTAQLEMAGAPSLEVGQEATLTCRFEDKSNQYGKKYYLYVVSEEKIQAAKDAKAKKDAERKAAYEAEKNAQMIDLWKDYVMDSAKKGRIYDLGFEVLTKLRADVDAIKAEAKAIIDEKRAIDAEKYAKKQVKIQAENAKYKVFGGYRSDGAKDIGELFEKEGVVYRAVKCTWIPEDDGEDSGTYEPAHYEVKAEIVTDQESLDTFAAIKAEKQAVVATRKALNSLAGRIKNAGDFIERENGQLVEIPNGEVLRDTFNIYGGGEMLIKTNTHYWYIKNNGTDGGDWGCNNIRTHGAGAYGWKASIEEIER